MPKNNASSATTIDGRKEIFAKMKAPFTPPKLLKAHQSGSAMLAKNVEKHKMQNGIKINFGKRCFTPLRLSIFSPTLKNIKHKKNDANPIS